MATALRLLPGPPPSPRQPPLVSVPADGRLVQWQRKPELWQCLVSMVDFKQRSGEKGRLEGGKRRSAQPANQRADSVDSQPRQKIRRFDPVMDDE
ncbi:hypothetical protein D4764_05G0002410 [Takifugu flavidus]|uniref:Uncharacterized protein n=1 Tax=Takifugu flavidus TaxID=433684 RepID=A0A5C6N1E7_9TELE|nr:hypothetical protein D4764_05G0002410 [Takifugu flavidus]